MNQARTDFAGVNYRLEGKVALVTGGSMGIGFAIARKLLSSGASVCITARDVDRGVAAARELGGQVVFVSGDMSVSADVKRAVDETVASFGGLDFLVNNAARSQSTLTIDMDESEWDEVIRSVLYSVFYGVKHAVGPMRVRGGGAIVNIGSNSSFRPAPGIGAYAAGKAGVVNLTMLLAQELREDNIRVNCIAPGAIYTPIWEGVRPGFEEKLGVPLEEFFGKIQGRWGQPSEIADATAFLCSDESLFMTGSTMTVDGGVTARLF